jgi:hypothetical protein
VSCRQLWTLRRISNGLTQGDPQLAAMLTLFARLAAREQMPVHERLRTPRSGGWGAAVRPVRRMGALIVRALGRLGDGLRTAAAACAAADRWLAARLPEAAPGITAAGVWAGVQPDRPDLPHR